jgi:hypothetical protein
MEIIVQAATSADMPATTASLVLAAGFASAEVVS